MNFWGKILYILALIASIKTCGTQLGDVVIVLPQVMMASALTSLVYGAVPISTNIDEEKCWLMPKKHISPY